MAAVKEGDTRSLVLTEDLTRTQIVQYAGASGDYNPLHTDDMFTTEVAGYPRCVRPRHADDGHDRPRAHRLVRRRRSLSYGVRFVKQVFPGDALTATATVTSVADGVAEITVETVNQAGEAVVTGTAKARVD